MMDGMPNIPNFKGLVSSGVDAAISFGGAFVINRLFGNQWGVFNQFGIPVLLADNVTEVRYQSTSTVASAPIERGSFASYNKVGDPYQATVRMTKGSGGATMRGLFVGQLETLSKSTLLFHVITPEYVYRNASITGLDYMRTAGEGARLIEANITLEEVREATVSYDTEEVKKPEDSATKDGGNKQPQEPNDSYLYSIKERLKSSGISFSGLREGFGLWLPS